MDLKEQIRVALGLKKSIKLAWQEKAEDGTIFVSEADELVAGVDISVLTEDGTTIALPVGTYRTETTSFRVDEEGVVAEILTLDEEEIIEEEMAEEADVADWKGMEKRIKNLEDAVADLKARIGETEEVEMEDEKEEEEKKEDYEDEKVDVVEETVVEVVEVVEEAVAEIAAAIDDATPAEVTPDLATKAAEVAIGIIQEKAEEVAEVNLSKDSKVEKLNKKIKSLKEKLSRKPADSPLNVNKFSSDKRYTVSPKEYRKMSRKEKFLYDLNK